MNYKYYACNQFNERGEYCTHRYIKCPANKNIKDFLNKFEICYEETEAEHNRHMPFYQVEIPENA